MWQSWQNKILLEAAKHGYKSETAEFYEQELDEDYRKFTVGEFSFWPFKAGRMAGWNIYHVSGGGIIRDPKEGRLVGFIEKGVHSKTSSTPSKLRVAGSGPTNYDKLILNYWHDKSGYVPNNLNPSVANLVGPPAKMIEAISKWMSANPTKWKYM